MNSPKIVSLLATVAVIKRGETADAENRSFLD